MLFLCSTPIGNLKDLTLRAVEVLENCDVVAAEDTRRTGSLLAHLRIKKPLISCHKFNEGRRCQEIASLLREGKTVAYCSDAGMPLISDPGSELVAMCIEQGFEFTILPGANAALLALGMSGLDCERFVFEGFLPREGSSRAERIGGLRSEKRTAIIYESPMRVGATLADLAKVLGKRKCALCRELTKLYEEAVRGTLDELAAKYESTQIKGECVLVIEGAKEQAEAPELKTCLDAMERLIAGGMRAKEAAKSVSLSYGVRANEIYELYMKNK